MLGPSLRLARLASALGVVAVLVACADQQVPTSPSPTPLKPSVRPSLNVIATTAGEASVCPEGPAGSYTYSISVTIPADWTNGSLTGTYSSTDLALAADANHQTPVVSPQTFTIPASNSGASCVLVFKVLQSINYVNQNGGIQDPVRLVTITQLSAPAGTQLDSIVSTSGGAPDVITLPPATTVVVDPNYFHGGVAAFWNSFPPSHCAVIETQLGAVRNGAFTLLALNNGAMTINSSTSITGNVGYSAYVTSTTNQKIDSFVGTAYVHSTANFVYTPATYQPTGGIIRGGAADPLLAQANSDVASASAYFAGLPSNGSLGNVTASRTLSAAGPITVFDVSSWNYNAGKLTLNGSPTSVFVFRVAGSFDWSQSQIVLNGVQPANIVWYFPNASAIDINKSSNVFAGTVLAPTGSVIYHNPATFNGAIIAKSIDVHSDFNIVFPGCK
jgi:hypothetical protein